MITASYLEGIYTQPAGYQRRLTTHSYFSKCTSKLKLVYILWLTFVCLTADLWGQRHVERYGLYNPKDIKIFSRWSHLSIRAQIPTIDLETLDDDYILFWCAQNASNIGFNSQICSLFRNIMEKLAFLRRISLPLRTQRPTTYYYYYYYIQLNKESLTHPLWVQRLPALLTKV